MARSFLLCITLSVLTAACSKTSAPTAPTPPAVTRIIRLGGNLNFGDTQFFAVRDDGVLTISNDGTENLQINFITYERTSPNLFVAGNILSAWCMEVLRPVTTARDFAVAPGQTLNVPFRFAPVIDPVRRIFPVDATYRFDCSGTLTVVGTQTSGTNTFAMTAIAVP